MNNIVYNIQLNITGDNKVVATVESITNEVKAAVNSIQVAGGDISNQFNSISNSIKQITLSSILDQVDRVSAGIQSLSIPGANLSHSMAELSAITGVTGQGLKEIEQAARLTSKTFGTLAVDNVESYKMMLSQLSPEIANNAEALQISEWNTMYAQAIWLEEWRLKNQAELFKALFGGLVFRLVIANSI